MRSARADRGFTLVELLVAIGIIGLLLSILLPSLNRARQQANLIVCQSNLKNIGIMISTYESENRGLTPPAWLGDRGPNAGALMDYYDATFADVLTLTSQSTKHYAKAPFFSPFLGGMQPPKAVNFEPDQDSGVFHDVDVPPVGWYPHSCSYVANVRALGAVGLYDPLFFPSTFPRGYHQRDIGTIKRAADAMMVWCGACDVLTPAQTGGVTTDTFNFGCFESYPDGLDDYQMYAVSGNHNGLCYPNPANSQGVNNPYLAADYEHQIALGPYGAGTPPLLPSPSAPSSAGPLVKPADLKAANQDANRSTLDGPSGAYHNGGYAVCYMRFRHMNDTTGNFLYCDGHVESKRLGEVVAKDVCLNPVVKP